MVPGDAYLAADRLHDAYGIHWTLVADTEAAHGPDASFTGEIRAAAERTEALLDASEDGLAPLALPPAFTEADLVKA